MFKKANPQQGFFKISMYGPPGSGKSFTTLLVAEELAKLAEKRIAYVDTERGTDFYAIDVKDRRVHPKAFDFDALYTTSLKETLDAVQSIDFNQHGVVVVDSISHLWDAAIAAYEGKKTKLDGIPMHAWGPIKKPFKELVRYLMDAPAHVFILGRQKNIFEHDFEKDQLIKIGVGMRAEGETEYEPHICVRMESKKDSRDSTRSTIFALFEKDRTGVLDGRTYPNPDFNAFAPVLPLLNGKSQAKSDDPDETAAKDSELLEKQEEKAKEKESKSLAMFNEFNGKIIGADSLEKLNDVSGEIKKKKRYMIGEHTKALREIFNSRRDELVKNVVAEA